MHPFLLILLSWASASLVMGLLYLKAYKDRDAGWVDVGWAGGIGLLALCYAAAADGWAVRKILVAGMVVGWSFRLAYFILKDRVLSGEEDARYQSLRAHWGLRAHRNFFWFFQAQALLIVLFSLPALVSMGVERSPLGLADAGGLIIWITAVAGEALADRQLARFRARPENRGRVCREGLWAWSRHPNYFFEWVHWWAYVCVGAGSSWWAATLLGPVLMLFFLFKVTGIPYTEKRALKTRGDAYREYQKTTSVFFPWFPKKTNSCSA